MAQAVEAGARRKASPDRRSRHRHGQDAGLPGARDSFRQARHHFHRHQESAGTALPQRHSFSRAGALSRRRRQAERLLHEGAQQLSLPQEALRPDGPARAHADWKRSSTIAPSLRGRKTTQTGDRSEIAIASRGQRALAQDRCPRRYLPRDRSAAPSRRCFITEMHRKAMESDIIIVNHHLFFADLGDQAAGRGCARCRHPARMPAP